MTQGDPMATTRLTMGANGEGAGAPMSALPEDDRAREPAIARPADPDLLHLAVVGDTYTVLLSGEPTAGRLAMLDMLIPRAAGRHRTGTTSRSASVSLRAARSAGARPSASPAGGRRTSRQP